MPTVPSAAGSVAVGDSLRLIAARGTYLDDSDVDRFLGLSFPGADELGGFLELPRVAAAGRYDTVVVDTAPTGHTLRLLAVPEVLQRIAAVLGEMLAKHHFLLTRLSGRDRRDAADGLVAEIAAEAGRLAGLLRDRHRCRFRWIVLPEALAVEEARDAVQQLEPTGIAIDEILVNRVTAGAPETGSPFDRRRVIAERAAIETVREAFSGRPVRLVPELAGDPRGPVALRPLVRRLARRAPARERPGMRPAGRSALRLRAAPSRKVHADWGRMVAPAGLRLLLVTGKGGVGKTTCAAAAALALGDATPIRRILLLSTDPAHSLGDVFGLRVGDEERRVPGGPPALTVREVDADRVFAGRRDGYRAAVDELFDAIRGDSRFDVAFDRAVVRDLLDLAPGGLDELCALLTVTETLFPGGAAAPRHDLVIVDTAPTGHTLRLLALPGLALEWIRALLSTMLKYRQVLGLGALGADLVELSRGVRQLQTLLADPGQARVVVVSRAAALPRLETIRLLKRLDALGLALSALIVNALTPAEARRATVTDAEAADARLAWPSTYPGRPLLLAPAVAPRPGGSPTSAIGRGRGPGQRHDRPAHGVSAATLADAGDIGEARGRLRLLRRAKRPATGSSRCASRTAGNGEAPRAGRRPGALADRGRRARRAIRRGRAGASRSGSRRDVEVRAGPFGRRRPLRPAHPVLPLRLLTLFSSDERAVAQVGRRRAAIAGRLAHVAGRSEWGVQVRLDADRGPSARRTRAVARRETAGLSPGTRFLELRRRQREAKRGVVGGARAAAASLYRTLARYAAAARQRPPVSVDGQPTLLLDAAFLVPSARAARFRRAVRAQAAEVADRGLHVRFTGPWPPYSFVAGRL